MRLGTSRTSWGWSNLALSPNLSHLSLSGSPQGVGKEGSEPRPRSWMETRRGKGREGEGGHPCPHRDLDRNCPLWAVGTPLTSLCREGEGWERKTQFFWGGNTPWTHSFAGIGGSCRKKGQNSPQTPGWDRLGASNTFNALEFFPFPLLAPGLVLPVPWAWWQWLRVLAVSWGVTSLSPGTEPWGTPGWDLLAWELLFWERRDQSLTLGGNSTDPAQLGFSPAFLGHLDPCDVRSCHL